MIGGIELTWLKYHVFVVIGLGERRTKLDTGMGLNDEDYRPRNFIKSNVNVYIEYCKASAHQIV